jgi:hypothetical protein
VGRPGYGLESLRRFFMKGRGIMGKENEIVSWRWVNEHFHLLSLIVELEEQGIDVEGKLRKKLREVRGG